MVFFYFASLVFSFVLVIRLRFEICKVFFEVCIFWGYEVRFLGGLMFYFFCFLILGDGEVGL